MIPEFDVVVPTVGRPSLAALLAALGVAEGPRPGAVLVVDDRREASGPLDLGSPAAWMNGRLRILRGHATGPAAARNVGWRASRAPWVAFLDDDVVPEPAWFRHLAEDLAACHPPCVATQGRVHVPLPEDRAPTDWERNVAGLAAAPWITADCAYRRTALQDCGGFDERFPRAYREDADLALRLQATGGGLYAGKRAVQHPVRPADPWVSVRLQAGNGDDALMLRLHGPDWRQRVGAPRGAFRRHAATVVCAGAALTFGIAWAARTAAFAWARIEPGPRNAREIVTMLATSVVIPFAAVYHRLRGSRRASRLARRRTAAVLFDRDGTLVHDTPVLGDTSVMEPTTGAREAVARLRAAGIAVGVVSNQPAVADGLITEAALAVVNERIDRTIGPFDVWRCCPHGSTEGCRCRKPAPGLVQDAAAALGVAPRDCVVIGDIGTDMEAARAAGARGVLVPTPVTLQPEIVSAPVVARDLQAAVDLVLAGVA